MKQKFYEIRNLENPQSNIEFLSREGKCSFFSSHPMRKVAKDIKYSADLFYYSHYESRSSCASKGTEIVTIYTYGEEKQLRIKGWIFPNKFKLVDYMSANGKIWYTMISFTCKKPDGQDMLVFYRTQEDTFKLLSNLIKTLTDMSGYIPNSYSYDIYPGFSRY